jgi:hypothetical protein
VNSAPALVVLAARYPPCGVFTLGDWWTSARKQVGKPHRMAFDSIVLLTTRMIWLEQNGKMFNRTLSTRGALGHSILVMMEDWCHAKLVSWSSILGE